MSATGRLSPRTRRRRLGWPNLAVAYVCVTAIVTALVWAVGRRIVPPFFIEGTGATALDRVVLLSTATMFAASSVVLAISAHGVHSWFYRWYALGMASIAVGLEAAAFVTRIGNPLNWAARALQYLGSIYLLVAATTTAREPGRWRIPLERALREREGLYRTLVELSPDAILVHSDGVSVFANTASNPAAEQLFPDLPPRKLEHPWFQGWQTVCAGFRGGTADRMIREVEVEGRLYEQLLLHVPKAGRVRMYSLDITDRRRASEALLRTAERDLRERSDQLRLLASELTLAEQRERQRLALLIHDGLQQLLVSATWQLEKLERTEDPETRRTAAAGPAIRPAARAGRAPASGSCWSTITW